MKLFLKILGWVLYLAFCYTIGFILGFVLTNAFMKKGSK